jgi:small subunit ribosomal protein S6e
MVFKLNISDKGKAWKIESNAESLIGKKIGDEVDGSDLAESLSGYTLKITGGTDSSGFPHKPNLQGSELKRLIFTKGWGMHKKPRRGGKKKVQTVKGLRLRKTVRGAQISEKSTQINIIVTKHGSKSLKELFPEQNQPKEKKTEAIPAQ